MALKVRPKILNSYYASVFCCDRNIREIQLNNSSKSFIINTRVIRKILAKIWRNKSVWPDGVPDEILNLGGKAMTTCLAGIIEISINSATISREWKIAIVFHIYKGGYRSALSNYRPINSTSEVYRQLEHVIAGI